jgi:hypothetical protein
LCAALLVVGSAAQAASLVYRRVPDLPRPGYLQEVRDPVFGGRITRISDTAGWRNLYAKSAAWNADGSRAALFGYGNRLLDGRTYRDLGSLPGLPGRPTWSNVNPRIIWGTNNDDNRLKRYNIVTKRTTYRSFPGFREVDLGNGEGNISDKDRFFALIAYPRRGGVGILMYDRKRDKVLGYSPLGIEPDWAGASPSGKYIVVRYPRSGTGRTEGFWLFDRRANRKRLLSAEVSHADFARLPNGAEILVHHRSGGRITARLLSRPRTWDLLRGSAFTDGHVSGRNIKKWGWVFLSNHVRRRDGLPGQDQIIAVKTDGSGKVKVFSHARTIQAAGSYSYAASTMAVPNRNGTKVMWGGRWNGSGGIYAYVVTLR